LAALVLGVVRARMNLKLESATERFRTIVAAQPAATKRQKATDDQVAEFVNDLAVGVPEITADDLAAARRNADRPTIADISALRVLLDLKPRDVPDHPAPAVTLPVQHPAGLTPWFAVMDLSEFRRQGWTLVGGQLVHLLA